MINKTGQSDVVKNQLVKTKTSQRSKEKTKSSAEWIFENDLSDTPSTYKSVKNFPKLFTDTNKRPSGPCDNLCLLNCGSKCNCVGVKCDCDKGMQKPDCYNYGKKAE
ncbi:MAG: hypothetical protein ABIE74_03810 [Pseudomonadota bacterium]